MSILSASPQDNRLFNAEIASKLGDINAAVIIQQLHYWMSKEGVGTVINGVKFIYNSFNDWVKQFPWLSVWQFRKAMKLLRDLRIVRVIRYKAKCWNQTNYYTLDSDRLLEYLNPKTAETIEISELWSTTDRDVNNQQIEVRDNELSYIESKKTVQRKTAESKETSVKRSPLTKEIADERGLGGFPHERLVQDAAAPLKNALEEESSQKKVKTSFAELNGLQVSNKPKLEPRQRVVREESKRGDCSINVTKKMNSKWKSLIDDLDGLGVPINKTLVSLVKMYEEDEVRSAITKWQASPDRSC